MIENSRLDVVLRGAGARGVALYGAVTGFESAGYTLNRVIGISGGAIAATLHAVGYRGRDLERLSLEQTPQRQLRTMKFIQNPSLSKRNGSFYLNNELTGRRVPKALSYIIDKVKKKGMMALPGVPQMCFLAEWGGLFSAEHFTRWLIEKMESKETGLSQLSFKSLYEKTGKHLSLVVTDVTDRTMRILNHHTTPNCPVVFGVRMSMNLPLVWPEITWERAWGQYLDQDISGNIIEDGCLSSGLPLYLLTSNHPESQELMGANNCSVNQAVGVYLDDRLSVDAPTRSKSTQGTILDKVVQRIERQLHLALERPYDGLEPHQSAIVCPIPSRGYGVLEFNMSSERVEAVMAAANRAVSSAIDFPKKSRAGVLNESQRNALNMGWESSNGSTEVRV